MNEKIKEEIMGAVARGWCSKENSHKIMDTELAISIIAEMEKLVEIIIEECVDQVYPEWIKSHTHIEPINLADAVVRIRNHFEQN